MADVYNISSSPPPRHLATFDMSSSPPLPSIKDIINKKAPVLFARGRESPVPQNASASFTTASALLNQASSKDLDDVRAVANIHDKYAISADPTPKTKNPKKRKVAAKKVDNGEAKVAKPRKTAAKKDAGGECDEPVKKLRKPRAKKADTVDGQGVAVKEPISRKPRAKKADKETLADDTPTAKPTRKTRAKKPDINPQSKLPKGKVTKPPATGSGDGALNLKTAVPKKDTLQDSVDYGLVEAVRRRTAWTPPPPTAHTEAITPLSIDPFADGPASASSIVSGERTRRLTDLIGSYSFMKAENATNSKKTSTVQATRKRKLMELVKTSVATAVAASASPQKGKAPKKKARTITEQATSAYAEAEDVDELPQIPAPLLQYFPLQTTERITSDGFVIPQKPRSKTPVKGGLKAKKGLAKAPILLSPASALKEVGNQDFVFGTSSQLAREDSPTLLRDLHEAMLASNEIDHDDPLADCLLESAPHTIASGGKASISTKRNLWSAASRDASGKLKDIEMVDLADSSPVATKKAPALDISDIPSSIPNDDDEEFWHDVEVLSQSISQEPQPIENFQVPPVPPPVEDAKNSGPLPTPPPTSVSEPPSPQLTKAAASSKSPKASPPSPKRRTASPKRKTIVAKTKDLTMPDFNAYTTAQLAKDIASYRFKPIKSRSSMITLLERCWEGKNRAALASLSTNNKPTPRQSLAKVNAPVSSQKEISPKRARGRPRRDGSSASTAKAAAKSPRKKAMTTVEFLEMDSDTPLSQIRTPKGTQKRTEEVEDIVDSDTPTTPSPRRTPAQMKIKPLTLTITSSTNDDSVELSPISSQKLLFKHITSAVTAAPRSKDSSNPSWHEKILLYDPIILEDLAVWLNTGGLEKVGWDGEVDPKEVKKWCESKSICCLWRESLRNGSRSRY
ncbi:uncharacterized protein L3040_007485 [Drepanopeziza brunnea f. sp. 'multigermtubi']|uniref:Structure-specific endonuclease subunit SLX4 n=1 Tax=Marssonina brunnea f. sp. multigermtubi (strain MB_m1) TaxID=1072389 RepID=K1X0H6_MARBU|nr:AT hook domain-containing protein [Drepanopeziza brunnea f. sp. 'multigermtubi' MB_m1]EKD18492.1 AT hook domain-containing protein [Drepanopeziza brunnea f. sp. 'multigermtubi' MB_m1]KAJ5037308.1 hypothetical protein L3040_007485 [Drepanopeziza brunnea f. sp. 'multigermtubi']